MRVNMCVTGMCVYYKRCFSENSPTSIMMMLVCSIKYIFGWAVTHYKQQRRRWQPCKPQRENDCVVTWKIRGGEKTRPRQSFLFFLSVGFVFCFSTCTNPRRTRIHMYYNVLHRTYPAWPSYYHVSLCVSRGYFLKKKKNKKHCRVGIVSAYGVCRRGIFFSHPMHKVLKDRRRHRVAVALSAACI